MPEDRPTKEVVICWFRRDLRLEDHLALYHALDSAYPVLPLFIFDEEILDELPPDDARVSFIHERLEYQHDRLMKKDSAMLIMKGHVSEVWARLLKHYRVRGVYINSDYEPYATERDAAVEHLLSRHGIPLHRFKDQLIFEPGEVLKQDGTAYTVFTPFKRRWLELFDPSQHARILNPEAGRYLSFEADFPSLEDLGFRKSEVRVAGYNLDELGEYAIKRDLPARDATSRLSPHLRFGTISIRQVIGKLEAKDEVFLSELIWREFFMHILCHFPGVVDRNFRRKYDGIQWRNDPAEFELWCQGKTGYPMVDAGMRELNRTGFMHNRVRMVCASFLCKHLLIDWRWGEAYFAEKLLDYELSSNNGNWQWAAGTGCDAAPYFRVFNPQSQQEKFDPHMVYIKRWLPEFPGPDYPDPIVEHAFARQRALQVYRSGIEASGS